MLHLDYRDGRPLHRQVRDGLRRLMLSGVLQAGDQLPSVRKLATELAINPNTIQRAYAQLEAEGFFARAVCHELDHLDGRVYIDVMDRELTPEEIEGHVPEDDNE